MTKDVHGCVAHGYVDDQHDCQASAGSRCFASKTSLHSCRVICHSGYSLL